MVARYILSKTQVRYQCSRNTESLLTDQIRLAKAFQLDFVSSLDPEQQTFYEQRRDVQVTMSPKSF